MKYGIKTLDDFDFKDKTVIARLDLNSPYDSEKGILFLTEGLSRAFPLLPFSYNRPPFHI